MLGVPNMVGDWPTIGLLMKASSLATLYVTTLLDTVGLRGYLVFGVWEDIELGGNSTGLVKSFIGSVTKSTLCLDLDEFIFMPGGVIP